MPDFDKIGLRIPPGPELARAMWDAHAQPGERYSSPYDRMRVARRYVKDRYGVEGWHVVRYIGPCDGGGKVMSDLDAHEQIEEFWRDGFSDRDLARTFRVDVPTVQRWRKGGPIKIQHRAAIQRFYDVHHQLPPLIDMDPAAWWEVPLHKGAPITPLDLYERHPSWAIAYARSGDPVGVLNIFEPNWRAMYDDGWETFVASDGHLSIRMKGN